MALWCLFNFNIKEINNSNIILIYLLLEITIKSLNREEILFNYFNKS